MKVFEILSSEERLGYIGQYEDGTGLIFSLIDFHLPLRAVHDAHIGNIEDLVTAIFKFELFIDIGVKMASNPKANYTIRIRDNTLYVMDQFGEKIYNKQFSLLRRVEDSVLS